MAEPTFLELAGLQNGMNDRQRALFISQYNFSKKDRTVSLVLSIFLGHLGIDRFYVGDTALGVIKLLTCGGGFIWWFIDLFLIMDRTDQVNRANAYMIALSIKGSPYSR